MFIDMREVIFLQKTRISGIWSPTDAQVGYPNPLIVCVHGGGCTSQYFDVPGASMLEAANEAGFDVFSVDRPDHGASPRLSKGMALLNRNAIVLVDAIDELMNMRGGQTRQVVLIGQSIGAAIVVCMGSIAPSWLAGIALSGVGHLPAPSRIAKLWKLLPPLHKLPTPRFVAFEKLFGPRETFDLGMANLFLDHAFVTPVLQELVEIYDWWPEHFRHIASGIRVPVDYVMGEYDALWVTNRETVTAFGERFANSPRVRSEVLYGAGHCIDHHLTGPAFLMRQVSFASDCLTSPASKTL